MAEQGADDVDRAATPRGRPTAASIVAELWSEREQSTTRPSVPAAPELPVAERAGTRGVVVGVVLVALLLGGGAGFFLYSQGLGQTSLATFVRKADSVCAPGNGAVAALAKPSSYPELATAAGTVVTSTGSQLTALGKLSAPGGADGDKVGALLSAMTQTNAAGRSLQDAAGRADDRATAAAANQLRTSSTDASGKATALGMAACATGIQGGLDTVAGGATGIVKTAFTAKADTICRESARALEGIRPPRDARDLVRYVNQSMPVLDKLVLDIKALPVPPGDEGTIGDIVGGIEKLNGKAREVRDAVTAGDRSRVIAIDEEATVLSTAVDAKLDAYGLTSCGSNFGGR